MSSHSRCLTELFFEFIIFKICVVLETQKLIKLLIFIQKVSLYVNLMLKF